MAIPAPAQETESPLTAGGVIARVAGVAYVRRLALLVVLFACEICVLSYWLDTPSAATGLTRFFATIATPLVRAIMTAVSVFSTFAYVKYRGAVVQLATEFESKTIDRRLLSLHAVSVTAFGGFWFAVYRGIQADWIAALWFLSGVLTVIAGAFALIPAELWLQLLRRTGTVGGYALAAGILSFPLRDIVDLLWRPFTNLTFATVVIFLRPFAPDLIADPATRDLGTPRFLGNLHPTCSGLEGVGLILVFGVLALLLFRDECRFPRALIVLPLGACISWLLNAVRLTALILIGDAGFPEIAMGGFHSQAGWIVFTIVAIGLTLSFRRIQWLRVATSPSLPAGARRENDTAPYLLPFLSILAAGMIAGAASGTFEWLYPLRVFAAVAVLWKHRESYRGLNWRSGWGAVGIGAIGFGTWLALHMVSRRPPGSDLAVGLSALPHATRVFWIVMRVIGAIVTVPVAEELAFRGFLMRRLVAVDLQAVSFRHFQIGAVLISSVCFGILHAHRVAATLAGILYAIALVRRGRIGDAVTAHATTNGLLAVYILITRDWDLW